MEEEEEEVTDDERIYLARVDAGLPTLQSIDICLAYTVSESPPRAPAPSCTRSLVHPDLDLEIQISRSRSCSSSHQNPSAGGAPSTLIPSVCPAGGCEGQGLQAAAPACADGAVRGGRLAARGVGEHRGDDEVVERGAGRPHAADPHGRNGGGSPGRQRY